MLTTSWADLTSIVFCCVGLQQLRVNDKSCVEVARLLDVQFETVKEEVATVSDWRAWSSKHVDCMHILQHIEAMGNSRSSPRVFLLPVFARLRCRV